MTQYDKVIDKYWIDFLVARKGNYPTEGHSYFWYWYYATLCENSRALAEQRWKEAQDVSSK